MRQIKRLLSHLRPYSLQFSVSLLLMAAVGLLDAFRVLLIGPILDAVLNPSSPTPNLRLFGIPGTSRFVQLQQFVPSYFHNPLTVVAVALVGSALIKGLCDYLGTYLVNYAGFGLTTDLRNKLYDRILHRSISFFSRTATGKLVSTVINDVDKVQVTFTIALAEFLRQLFTLIFMIGAVIVTGHRLSWILLLFVPFVVFSAGRIGRRVRQTTRKGQGKLADIPNLLHGTATGQRLVQALTMERWEGLRFHAAARKLFRAHLKSVAAQAISSPLMDILGVIAAGALLWVGRTEIKSHAMTTGMFFAFIFAVFKLYDPVRKIAFFHNSFHQAAGA